MVKIIGEEPIMSEYKENLYSFALDDGISIPGWRLVGVDYENSGILLTMDLNIPV